ncbi:hypothetical protein ACVIM9_008224 [Bradyrhizobium sp. USDA 4520]
MSVSHDVRVRAMIWSVEPKACRENGNRSSQPARSSVRVRRISPVIIKYSHSSFVSPHQPRPFFGHVAPFVGWMAASAVHSSSSFRSQAMHPPSPVQGPPPEGRDWRGQNDGGNHASIVHRRTDAADGNGSVRSSGGSQTHPAQSCRHRARASPGASKHRRDPHGADALAFRPRALREWPAGQKRSNCQESRNNRGPQQGSTHLRSSG